MRPEKIRFEREINGRKVCKKFIARLEPVLLFEDGYIRTHYNTVNYNWPRQMTRVGFANIKYQIACILKGFNKLYIGTFK